MLLRSVLRRGVLRRTVLLAAAVSALGVTGCSGGAGNGNGGTGNGGGDDWDGHTNVEAIFEASCSSCHGSQWSSCWQVNACAPAVESEVSSGAMPLGGGLSTPDRTTLTSWLAAGAPSGGAKPADVGGCGGGGGTPIAAGADTTSSSAAPAH
ncbi:MAG TPA: hypothetical protein VIY73_12050 [Polyangiaceae bacterium]